MSARGGLLPNANSAISEAFEKLNLRTLGVESPQFPTAVTFNYCDARAARLHENLLDFVLLNNLHSASESQKEMIGLAMTLKGIAEDFVFEDQLGCN
jgi:hypothetical protein